MAGGRRKIGAPQVLGGLVVLAVALLVIKWLLITALILVVPFGIWWAMDRARATPQAATPRPAAAVPATPASATPMRVSPTPAAPLPPTRFGPPVSTGTRHMGPRHPVVPVAARVPGSSRPGWGTPAAPRALSPEREVVVTREEDHQDVLARHLLPGAPPRQVMTTLHPSIVSKGRYQGDFAIEVRLDHVRVGELTAGMSERYRPFLTPEAHAQGAVSHGDRGFQLDLRLPAVS